MILYLSVIIFSMIVVSVFNILFGLQMLDVPWWFVIVCVVLCVIYQFAVDGFFAIVIKKTPDRWYGKDKKIFQVSASEIKFLNFFRVKKWKEKVWELGGLGGFRKNKILEPQNPEYVEKFITETNKGVVIHWIGVFVGYTAIVAFPFRFALTICLPIAFVNMVLNFLPIMVLRYNIPKLLKLQKFLDRKKVQNV